MEKEDEEMSTYESEPTQPLLLPRIRKDELHLKGNTEGVGESRKSWK